MNRFHAFAALALAAATAAAIATPALAQEKLPAVRANKSTAIWTSYACGSAYAASWSVRVPPKHGTVEIRKIAVDPKTTVRCFNNPTPPTSARALIYTPAAGFKGIDSMTVGWLGGEYHFAGEQLRSVTFEVK